ncbi:MAG: hypothetical protein LIP11_17615 [Clostridiales bacterium]|nr:hypothetical protein [Clostridiales bacterium]
MAMNRELTEQQALLMQATGKPHPRREASHPADGINHAESRIGAMVRPASMICWRKSRTIPGFPKEQELEKKKDAAAERLRESACKIVEITAHDGIRLIGHLHLAESPERTIIAVHGWRASWTGRFGLIADFLYENGCNVLYIEQRAHGAFG